MYLKWPSPWVSRILMQHVKKHLFKDIEKLRITCGVDIEYGWVVERDPTVQLSLAQLFTAEQMM